MGMDKIPELRSFASLRMTVSILFGEVINDLGNGSYESRKARVHRRGNRVAAGRTESCGLMRGQSGVAEGKRIGRKNAEGAEIGDSIVGRGDLEER
jgi:hypothetical protein